MEDRMKLDQQQELLADAVRATSEHYHIVPIYIEKDYWISKILQQLSRSCYAENIVFKGGTSLSKGYGLINRFSEDVDVAVLTGELSGNQIKALISKVCKAMTQGLQEQDVPELTSKGSRYRKALFNYPSSVNDPMYSFVANRVIVEINSFANPYPYEKRQIKSFITSYMEEKGMQSLIEEYDLHPFDLNVLDKRRTLCEKVVSLLRFSFTDNPVEGLSSKIRHFYDIYFLLNDAECMEYIKGDFIKDAKELIEHDKETFDVPEKWKDSLISKAPLLNSFDELWKELSGLYETELKALAYSQIPKSIDLKRKIGEFLIQLKQK